MGQLQGQGHRVKNNGTPGFITRNTHVKYQSSSIHCSKVISKVKVFKNGSNSKANVTGSIIRVTTERSFHKEYSCQISKLQRSLFKNYQQGSSFLKMGQLQGQGHRGKNNGTPGFITRNTHVKYQSSSTHCSKVIRKVKVFKKQVKLKGQGHMVKNNGTN